MEKKIIYFNEQQFKRQKDVFTKNLEILNEAAELYSKLEIGEINHQVVEQMFQWRNFTEIEAKFKEMIAKKSQGQIQLIANTRTGEEMMTHFRDRMTHLADKFNRNQNRGAEGIIPTPANFFAIVNGKFKIAKPTWDKIKCGCSNVIETEQEQKIYEALQKLAAASNDFLSALGPNMRERHFNTEPWDFLVLTDNGQYEPENDTDFQYLAK